MLHRYSLSLLFPYTTLFRSAVSLRCAGEAGLAPAIGGPLSSSRCFPDSFWSTGRSLMETADSAALRSSILYFATDRKSTRLNSSHRCSSYAVFCLKKKIAGKIGSLITISTTPVIAGDSFEMDAVGALRLSPLRRGLAIDSTVDIFTFYVPHRHVYGEQWIKFMIFFFNATAPPDVYTLSLHDALPI